MTSNRSPTLSCRDLLLNSHGSPEEEPRVLELLTQLEHFAAPGPQEPLPTRFSFRRVYACFPGKLGLALMRSGKPSIRANDEVLVPSSKSSRRWISLRPLAKPESHRPSTMFPLVLLCINVFATHADSCPPISSGPSPRNPRVGRRFDKAQAANTVRHLALAKSTAACTLRRLTQAEHQAHQQIFRHGHDAAESRSGPTGWRGGRTEPR